MSTPIEGLKVIRFNSARINEPDDPSYPYKLVINLRPPDFMQVAFIMLYGGSEELLVRALTRKAIDDFVAQHDFHHHPRLRHMTLTAPGPDGTLVETPL